MEKKNKRYRHYQLGVAVNDRNKKFVGIVVSKVVDKPFKVDNHPTEKRFGILPKKVYKILKRDTKKAYKECKEDLKKKLDWYKKHKKYKMIGNGFILNLTRTDSDDNDEYYYEEV